MKIDAVRVFLVVLHERKHIFKGEVPSEECRGAVEHSEATVCVESHPILAGFLQAVHRVQTMSDIGCMDSLKIFFFLNHKSSSNCKLGSIFQRQFLLQIPFSLIYEKPVASGNVHG